MIATSSLEIDEATGAALGFPRLKYAWIERERRWLCKAIPMHRVLRSEAITDLYVTGTQLRLREALPLNGGAPVRRLSRKADVNARTRLLTSIYLSPEEFALFAVLPGRTLRKTRYHLGTVSGAKVSIDRFEGPLSGLILAEAEFDIAEALEVYSMPDFAWCDVTDDPRYAGGSLVAHGMPADDHAPSSIRHSCAQQEI